MVIVNQMLEREFANVRALAQEVEQVHQIRQHLKTILSIHQDIETGQRGYVLTRDPAFLDPYAAAEQNLVAAHLRRRRRGRRARTADNRGGRATRNRRRRPGSVARYARIPTAYFTDTVPMGRCHAPFQAQKVRRTAGLALIRTRPPRERSVLLK
ncbi:CHASE3 domain-containing protein [Sphingomonas sp. LY54]|uniref:CHASE3 domain-containing protein n=1 Tax=Sphingomonas sp. LY54 TaxID=3095343 RepID=UPI002D7847F2|nr:CHASE3 domain-containing protein [Sphingomonas sp. LY54]WRP27757.1 CHASE3 domain-containing protein [Sphingomonas sp. LY54]